MEHTSSERKPADLGSISTGAMSRCVLGKDTLHLCFVEARQSINCVVSAWQKTCKQNPKNGALRCWVRLKQSARFIRTNKPKFQFALPLKAFFHSWISTR